MFGSIHNAFGLDISDLSLKLVLLRRQITYGKIPKIALANFGSLPLPSGIIEDGRIKDKKKLILAISRLIKNNLAKELDTRGVVANLPDSETFLTTVDLPDGEKNLEEAILRAVEKNIPLPPTKINYDWRIQSRDKKTIKILIGAVHQDTADAYTEVLEGAGCVPIALEIESLANLRALTSLTSPPRESLVILDLGAVRSGLIIYDQGAPQLSLSLPISGNSITETIADSLKINFLEAEKIKIRCGFDVRKCDIELKSIVNQLINELVAKIKTALRFYEDKTTRGQFKPSQIILCGGGANLSKIDTVLGSKLKMRVRSGNPLINLTASRINLGANQLEFTTAIGLALSSMFMFQNGDPISKGDRVS